MSTEKKKLHNLKEVESYVLFGRHSKDLSPGHSLSDYSRQLRRGKEGARIYRSVCNKDQVTGTSKDYY